MDFIATPSTRIMPLHGPVVEGACAKVEYRVVNGQNIADRDHTGALFELAYINDLYGNDEVAVEFYKQHGHAICNK